MPTTFSQVKRYFSFHRVMRRDSLSVPRQHPDVHRTASVVHRTSTWLHTGSLGDGTDVRPLT